MIPAVRAPPAVLVDVPDVVPHEPIFGSQRGQRHQITFRIEQPYLLLVGHGFIPRWILAITGKSICAMRSHLSSQSLDHWCSQHDFTGITTTQISFIKDNSMPNVRRNSRGLKTPKGGPHNCEPPSERRSYIGSYPLKLKVYGCLQIY